jgi:hypothetical protein
VSTSLRHVVDQLLSSAFSRRQPGGPATRFLFGRPGTPAGLLNLGAEVYFSRVGLMKTALLVRAVGPSYLRSLPISKITSRLMDFIKENFYLLEPHVWGMQFEESYASRLPDEIKHNLTQSLAASTLMSPSAYPTLFPLVPVEVLEDFVADSFFLIKADSLKQSHLRIPAQLLPTQFPPFPYWHSRVERPLAWLGVHTPASEAATKARNAILGAVALLPHPLERYQFSGREMFGGRASLKDGNASFSYSEPCTPAMMENIRLDAQDHAWMELLSTKLGEETDEARREIKALEYFYRAWPLSDAERFPVLFMALDALFSNAAQHTQAVADSVGTTMGTAYDVTRLKLLLKMRAAVIHGGAPDVYDASHYVKYYEAYEADAVADMERIAAECIRQRVFGGSLSPKPHHYAHILKEHGIEP